MKYVVGFYLYKTISGVATQPHFQIIADDQKQAEKIADFIANVTNEDDLYIYTDVEISEAFESLPDFIKREIGPID